MIDESSRSDDSNLDKPVAQNVTNEDSDSQTSSNKRLVFYHLPFPPRLSEQIFLIIFLSIFFHAIYRSLDCESSESQTTVPETSEPETKKCKITEE